MTLISPRMRFAVVSYLLTGYGAVEHAELFYSNTLNSEEWGQHGGSVVSTVASQQEGPGFASRSFQVVPGPFCVEFACSPRACVGLLRVLRFPPPS